MKEEVFTPFLLGTIDLITIGILFYQDKLGEPRLTWMGYGALAGTVSILAHILRMGLHRRPLLLYCTEVLFSPFTVLLYPLLAFLLSWQVFGALESCVCYFMGGCVCWLYGSAFYLMRQE